MQSRPSIVSNLIVYPKRHVYKQFDECRSFVVYDVLYVSVFCSLSLLEGFFRPTIH